MQISMTENSQGQVIYIFTPESKGDKKWLDDIFLKYAKKHQLKHKEEKEKQDG